MSRHWLALLFVASSVWVVEARGQQQGQALPPSAANGTQSEISTLSMDAPIKVETNLVLVRVVVRDSRGNVVPGLKQEDFDVFDNGKKQKISAFNAETFGTPNETIATTTPAKSSGAEATAEGETRVPTSAPAIPKRFVALVFDDLHMKAADAMAVRSASEKLFASLTPTDRAAIYSTSGIVQQDFTADAQTLRKTLAAVIPHPAKGEGQFQCPNISYYQADLMVNKHDQEAIEAALEDAGINNCPVNVMQYAKQILEDADSLTRENYEFFEQIVKRLSILPGQRIAVYVSPGFILPFTILPTGGGFIEQAMKSGVVVNTIDARGLYTADVMPDIDAPPQGAPYKEGDDDYRAKEGKFRMQGQFESGLVLADMAASTGGTYFHNRNDLDVAMNQALAAPSVSYVLGFAPQNPMTDGKFHKLKVVLPKEKKYQIQARNGYYATKAKPASGDPEEMAKQRVREALLSQDEVVTIPVKVETEFSRINATSSELTALTHVDISTVQFRKADELNCNNLVLATGVFDSNGRLIDGQMKEIALRLKDSTRQNMNKTGLGIKITFTVKPGIYRVRSVVRGSEGDQLTARNVTIAIPGKQSIENSKAAADQNAQWDPPKVDARLKSLSTTPACNLSYVLQHTGVSALDLASNLQKFTAQEHIDYAMIDRAGMVEEYDSSSFDYVYSMEQQKGGAVSREYRTPAKGSHNFRASELDIGEVAIALIFHPDLQSDYEMQCEGLDERNGQRDWVVHFQQRKDKPSRTAEFWVDKVGHPGNLKGRAWISSENFQVLHLEASLIDDLPSIGLQDLAFSVDYKLVQNPSGSFGLWLPDHVVTYLNFDAHRIILAHTLADFQLFAVDTKENIREPNSPN